MAEDGGLLVDEEMRIAVPDLYAAGDACTMRWRELCPLWFQVRFRVTGMLVFHSGTLSYSLGITELIASELWLSDTLHDM